MREIEQSIIDIIKPETWTGYRFTDSNKQKLDQLFKSLMAEPLGKWTEEFVNDFHLGGMSRSYCGNQDFFFRFLIEKYLHAKEATEKSKYFIEIKNNIIEIKKETLKPSGQGLLPESINRTFIREIYLSNNKELIELFSENLPIPSAEIFNGYPVPPLIQQRTEETNKAMLHFLETRASAGKDFNEVESKVIGLQRKFRFKRRQKEEKERVSNYPYIRDTKFESEAEKSKFLQTELEKANTPYRPQKCSDTLAERIVNASKKVKLFSTIHHLTSEEFLQNIFDDCLYGRKNLLQSYIPFNPAALNFVDLEYGGGDARVICFGPNDIDPLAQQKDSIDLIFDIDKLKVNPSCFYKQRDLGYNPSKRREVHVGKDKLLKFNHTARPLKLGLTYLQLFSDSNVYSSGLPNFYFIGYNLPDMHQILTLNFFRFIDTLCNKNGSIATEMINKIYADIEQLDEEELISFLTELGQKMTDTAEFNFYGAYKIDFSALKSIYSKHSNYALNLPEFIQELQSDNQEKLKEAIEKIPVIFKSYRFIDYLLSNIPNELEVYKKLLELKKLDFEKTPEWVRMRQEERDSTTPSISTTSSKRFFPKVSSTQLSDQQSASKRNKSNDAIKPTSESKQSPTKDKSKPKDDDDNTKGWCNVS